MVPGGHIKSFWYLGFASGSFGIYSLINEEVKAYVISSEYDNESSGYTLLKKIAYNLCSTIKERIFDAEITLSKYFNVDEIEEYD